MKQKQNKKGDKEFSVTTIVIIVIFVTLLSLVFMWIRGDFKIDCSKTPNAKGCICDEYKGDCLNFCDIDEILEILNSDTKKECITDCSENPCLKAYNPNEYRGKNE